VCRNVSTTHSARFRARTLARMCVESVCCRPRAFNQPCSLHRSTTASREAFFSTQSHQTRPKLGEDRVVESGIRQFQTAPQYFQSKRLRTASAACRSVRFSMNWKTVTKASLHGA